MEKAVTNYIKASLRRTWGRSKQRQSALKAAKVAYGKYKCNKCGGIFQRKMIEVDHIVAIGKCKDFNIYIERLFYPSSGLQILCVACHRLKSKKDNKK